jgi:type IV secretory pathway VirB6-like protein
VVIALVSLAFTYGVYMVAAILNVAAVVVGPVFLALAAVPMTRRFAAGWFGVLVGGCCCQLMALAVDPTKEALQKPSASDRDIIRSGVDWRA